MSERESRYIHLILISLKATLTVVRHYLSIMISKRSIIVSFAQAASVLLYIIGVAWIMSQGNEVFGTGQQFWAPVGFLLLFVVSASIVGALVLGRPAYLYFGGAKKEGAMLLVLTICWLLVCTVGVLITLFVRAH